MQIEQKSCWLTYTNETTHDIIRANLDRSPLYSGMIEGIGPRYCPSIEDKVVRFADKKRHQVFIEPEGMYTNEMYIGGMSSSLPEDVQEVVKNFRSIADEASGMIRGFLKKARLSLGGDNRLLIVLPDAMSADMVGREDHVQELEQLIEEKIGKKVEVDVRHVEEGRHFEDTFVDIEQKINMEITVED